MGRRSTPILVLIVTVFSAASISVHAETTFYEAYQAGLQYEAAGKWKEARDHFLEASSLKPYPARRLRTYGLNFLRDYDPYAHLAYCELQLGMFEEAMKHLEVSLKAGVTPAGSLQDLKERLTAELNKTEKVAVPQVVPEPIPPLSDEQKPAPRPATLRAESDPAGATVRIDGEDRGATPLRITLPPGTHNIEYVLQGFQSGHETVDLKEGETQTVTVLLSTIPPPQQEPLQQPPLRKSVETQPPTEKDIVNSSPEIPTQTETGAQQTREKITVVPLQKQTEQAGTHTGSESPVNARNVILFLLIMAAVVGSLLLRRHKTPSQQAIVPPGLSEPPMRNPAMADSPTHDIWFESASPAQKSVPVSEAMLEEIRLRSKRLPNDVPVELGGYQMMAVLGRGGMGTTFLAKRTRDGLPVAVKVPHDHLLDDAQFSRRFVREGSLGSTLHHPNIIRILEAGNVDNKPFIAMELLEGETLETKLRRVGSLSISEALEICRDVALALDYAHSKGIVHRDLKPENIMILNRGGLKVLDYGIAHLMDSPGLTSSTSFLGTPSYSAPESRSSVEVDQQSDLYSLGIILYRCLSGRLPFSSDDPLVVLDMHRSQALPPFPPESNLPDSIFRLVQKLTEKHKADRFENAELFLVELNRLINEPESNRIPL